MKHLFRVLLFVLSLFSFNVQAQEPVYPRPDDRVAFDVSAEQWVTTKTARVSVGVEAAVSANTAGTTRADMTKAVNSLAKADWRLTSFSRSQDQTGMERWSAMFEARVPEAELSGLGESAKKLSKAGMQLTVADIDFSATLEENEAARSAVRTQIYKIAADQLAALNAALPGRAYRIAAIDFTGEGGGMPPMPMMAKAGRAVPMMAVASMASAPEAAPVERSEKITLTARIVLAAVPDSAAVPVKH